MNTQLFADAMGELNDKYIMEAVSYQRQAKSQAHIWLTRAACFFLAVLLTGGAILTFNTEARAAFFGWMRQQVETYYMYFFAGEPTPSTPVKYELGWIPDGLEHVTTLDIDNGECFIYTDEQQLLTQFSYVLNGDNVNWSIDGVDYIQKKVSVNGNPADLYIAPTDDQTSSIIWANEKNDFFTLSAPFDEDTLIKMAESVRVKPLQFELGYIPEECIFVTNYETAGGEVYIYTDAQDTLIQFSYTSDPDNEKVYVDSAEYTEKQITINGGTGTIFTSLNEEETDGIVWTDPSTNTLFFISGHFDEATLIEMAQGVKEK